MLGRSITIGAATAALALCVAVPASAVVTKAGGGGYSYLPVKHPGSKAATPFAANGNLDYHGGPVMPAMHQYAIFWAPSGFSFPAGYQAAVTKYMQDLAADTGKPTNTTSVGAQYTDSLGNRANYNVSFGAAFNDTNPYPASGCLPYSGIRGDSFPTCLTDGQLQSEIDGFVSSHGNQRGLTNIYFLFLPDHVGTCFSSNPLAGCFDRQFCAYHSNFNSPGGQTIYTNESFAPADPVGCGTGNYPNGHANGNVDDELSSLSHEANEAREDPLVGTGWFNSNTGNEGADQCRNTGSFAGDYGPLLGGTQGIDGFNQVINSSHYILQMDWSNAHNGCEQRYNLTGTATGPSSGKVGQALSFSAGGADGDGGTVTGVTINFGDGTSASGPTASHAYSAPGTYHVTAQVANSTGLTATATGPTVTIAKPPPPSNDFTFGGVTRNTDNGTAVLSVTVPSAGTLTLAGRGVRPITKAGDHGKAVPAGTASLKVRAKGRARRKLRRTGKVRVTAKVTYTPNGGKPNAEKKRIVLRRSH